MDLISKAVEIAARAHAGQTRQGGGIYLMHPIRVMQALNGYSEYVQAAAVLHDVVEDTDVTLGQFHELFGADLNNIWEVVQVKQVMDTVDLLTHRKNVAYKDYIAGIKTDVAATAVKIADLKDNMNPEGLLYASAHRWGAKKNDYLWALKYLHGLVTE